MLLPARPESPALQSPPGIGSPWKCSDHQLQTQPPISAATERWKRTQCLKQRQGQGRTGRRDFKSSLVFCGCCKARFFPDFSRLVWAGFFQKQAQRCCSSRVSHNHTQNHEHALFFLLSSQSFSWAESDRGRDLFFWKKCNKH